MKRPLALACLVCASCGAPTATTDAGGPDAASDAAVRDSASADGAGGDGAAAMQIEGQVLFRALGEGVAMAAELYARPVSVTPPVLGDGHCAIAAPGADGDAIDGTFFRTTPGDDLDLGDALTATDGTATLVAMVDQSGTDYHYLASATMPGFDAAWTIRNSGSATGLAATTLAAFHTFTPVVASDAPVDTTMAPVVVTYSGGAGAMTFHINILASAGEVDCYPAPDSTSFQLPPNVVSHVGASFVPRVWAESVYYPVVLGHRIRVRVTSDNLD
jgi:hypothetical protein